MTAPLRIALAGLGTVGGGVIRLIETNGALIARRAGRPLEIVAVCARDRAKDRGVDTAGYRTVFNCNSHAGQTVFHIHLHLLAGRRLGWPPG